MDLFPIKGLICLSVSASTLNIKVHTIIYNESCMHFVPVKNICVFVIRLLSFSGSTQPDIMHGGIPDVFLHQQKLESSRYDLYSVSVTLNLTKQNKQHNLMKRK